MTVVNVFRWAPTIRYASTLFPLPPWCAVEISREQGSTIQRPRKGNRAVVTSLSQTSGTTISLTLSKISPEPSTREILDLFDELFEHFAGKEFHLHEFNDRAWRDCILVSQKDAYDLKPLTALIDTGIEIFCPYMTRDRTIQWVFEDEDDYQAQYPYWDVVGRPIGEPADPDENGGLAVVTVPVTQVLPASFLGRQEAVTSAANVVRLYVNGDPSTRWNIKAPHVASANPAGSNAATTVRFSNVLPGGSGSSVNCTVAQGQSFGAVGSGSFQVAGGSWVYAYLTAVGKHSDVQARVIAEAA